MNRDINATVVHNRQVSDMSKESPIDPAIRFKLNKPESLSKMSDLCYALDLYLNGDKKADSIEVVGIDEDD